MGCAEAVRCSVAEAGAEAGEGEEDGPAAWLTTGETAAWGAGGTTAWALGGTQGPESY